MSNLIELTYTGLQVYIGMMESEILDLTDTLGQIAGDYTGANYRGDTRAAAKFEAQLVRYGKELDALAKGLEEAKRELDRRNKPAQPQNMFTGA